MINISGRRIGSITGEVNLEVSEKMSNNYPVGEIFTRNHKMLR